MVIDARFPNRMHSSVFSANFEIQSQCQSNFNCASGSNEMYAPGGCYPNLVRFQNFKPPVMSSQRLEMCNNGEPYPGEPQYQSVMMTAPGALIPGGEGDGMLPIPSTANIRWLQTEGYREPNTTGGLVRLDTLFKSLDPSNPDFLVPKWDHPIVEEFIKNKGWADAGVRNSDGLIADLGAIPSNGTRQTTAGRLTPANAALVTDRNAAVSVSLTVESGVINNPTIKLLRWVSPVPLNNTPNINDWANNFEMIDAESVQPIPATNALVPGNNTFNFSLPRAPSPAESYGFFEMIVEGADAAGNRVTTDVGFLPYHYMPMLMLRYTADVGGAAARYLRARIL